MTEHGKLRQLRVKFMDYLDQYPDNTWEPFDRKYTEVIIVLSEPPKMWVVFDPEEDNKVLQVSYEDFLQANNIQESDFHSTSE